ncbi:2-isopropylmalate synthase [Sporobacter termitidis DSM 10068]|uniref:2-isopropylmalate synthase n=1 Tax=Sporobacter termitidis DSM 10068 TaxID=1123282 RepID=A0A1M5Z6F6_9FIRM|nr:alpha-isopropylmalate synthase regulatory domain-containing protein [Sporobacter termitidis]SHI19865.1 2-isopropylmalate synthase [Sporobacter termitidis DSM 10068]
MSDIKIVDISLRESEQLSASGLSFKQKIEMAKLLEKLKIDVIETGFVSGAPADAVLVRTLSTMLDGSVICVPVSLDRPGIERAASALSKAKKARLNLIVPASTVQMEYIYHLKADTVLSQVRDTVEYCVSLCPDVEFTAEDATRAEPDFLSAMLQSAISAGAKTVTLCDATGEKTPDEIAAFLQSVKQKTPALQAVTLSLHLRDNLGLAAASALAAVPWVQQFKVSCGAAPGHLPLEQFLNVLKVRGEALGVAAGPDVTSLFRTCRKLDALTGAGHSGRAAAFGLAGESAPAGTEVLSADADIAAVRSRIEQLGYEVSEEDLNEIYRLFKEIARSKKVDSRDIEALIADTAGQVAPTFLLDNYVINSGSAITATAFIRVVKDGDPIQAIALGDGPIDAAFNAIGQIIGRHYELDDFQIQAVTEGTEAMGGALVRLRQDGKLYAGRGLSTDIVGASIRAYLSAANKIVFEEKGL